MNIPLYTSHLSQKNILATTINPPLIEGKKIKDTGPVSFIF